MGNFLNVEVDGLSPHELKLVGAWSPRWASGIYFLYQAAGAPFYTFFEQMICRAVP